MTKKEMCKRRIYMFANEENDYEITEEENEEEILVWRTETFREADKEIHDNIYTFVIDLESKKLKAIFELVIIRHENNDSFNGKSRYTYVPAEELKKLEGKILKRVYDYKVLTYNRYHADNKYCRVHMFRKIRKEYFIVRNGKLIELSAKHDLRDQKGFYDEVSIDGKKYKIYRDHVEEA